MTQLSPETGTPPGVATAGRSCKALLHVQGEIIHDEGRLQRAVLGSDQVDLNGLALERADVEGLLRVAGVLAQVRVRGQRRQDGAAAVADLHLEGVEGAGGGRFRGVDVQPEGERGGGGGRGDGHRLHDVVGVRRARSRTSRPST